LAVEGFQHGVEALLGALDMAVNVAAEFFERLAVLGDDSDGIDNRTNDRNIRWPPHAEFDLGPIVGCFSGVDGHCNTPSSNFQSSIRSKSQREYASGIYPCFTASLRLNSSANAFEYRLL